MYSVTVNTDSSTVMGTGPAGAFSEVFVDSSALIALTAGMQLHID